MVPETAIKTVVKTKTVKLAIPPTYLQVKTIPLYLGSNGKDLLDYIIKLKSNLGQCHAQLQSIKQWDQDGTPRL